MHLALAITSILTLFLAVWAVNVMRDPRKWRLWWLHQLGVVDLNSTREERRAREKQMSLLAMPLFLLLFAISLSCAWWTYDQLRQAKGQTALARETLSNPEATP